MLRSAIASGLLALAMLAPASARARDFVPREVVQLVGIEDLRELVGQAGGTIVEGEAEGRPIVRATTADGLHFQLIGSVCDRGDASGCKGLAMQVIYEASGWVTDANVGRANTRYSAVHTWLDKGDESLGIGRYVILDGGVTRLNLLRNLQVLLELAPLVVEIAYGDD